MNVIPYRIVDGVPSFRDSEVMGFFDQMVKDGTVASVFIDGMVDTREKFLRLFTSEYVFAAAAIGEDGTPLGIGWLTSIDRKKAVGHFCVFSAGWGPGSTKIGCALVAGFLVMTMGGEPMFDVLLGFTSVNNRRAVEFLQECGGEVVGVLPYGVYNASVGESEPAVVVCFKRGR